MDIDKDKICQWTREHCRMYDQVKQGDSAKRSYEDMSSILWYLLQLIDEGNFDKTE